MLKTLMILTPPLELEPALSEFSSACLLLSSQQTSEVREDRDGGGALDGMMLTCDSSDVPLSMAQRTSNRIRHGCFYKEQEVRAPPRLHFQALLDKDQSQTLILWKKQIKGNTQRSHVCRC